MCVACVISCTYVVCFSFSLFFFCWPVCALGNRFVQIRKMGLHLGMYLALEDVREKKAQGGKRRLPEVENSVNSFSESVLCVLTPNCCWDWVCRVVMSWDMMHNGQATRRCRMGWDGVKGCFGLKWFLRKLVGWSSVCLGIHEILICYFLLVITVASPLVKDIPCFVF